MLDESGKGLKYPYFEDDGPVVIETTESYAGAHHEPMPAYYWPHSMGEMISVLISDGLSIQSLREFPYSPYDCFPFLEDSEPGRFTVKDMAGLLPMVYALRAIKT